jgi:2-hydroxy-3-oxopropionate reductase
MVGGEQALFDEYKPFFEAIGKKITYTGILGSAKDIKMLNQALNAGNSCVAAEVMMLAKQLGVDIKTLVDVVNDSSGGSWIFKNNIQRYIEHNHTPGFKLDLMKKDVSLFTESAREKGDFTPMIDLTMSILTAGSNQGHGEMNYTYISKWIEEQNNM